MQALIMLTVKWAERPERCWVQRAAVRKLAHELGIPAAQLPLSGFRFLTRLHYCAPDTGTYGPRAEWGEHEV